MREPTAIKPPFCSNGNSWNPKLTIRPKRDAPGALGSAPPIIFCIGEGILISGLLWHNPTFLQTDRSAFLALSCGFDIIDIVAAAHLNNLDGKSYYQKDLPGCLDPSFLSKAELEKPPLNAGFVIQGKRLDWSMPIARLNKTLSEIRPLQTIGDLGILEQSASHLAHFLAGSVPFGGGSSGCKVH